MSQRIDIEQELDRWLADGGDVVPDRVLDAALHQVDSTNQRSAGFGRPWRTLTMKLSPSILAGIAGLAVVVLVVALLAGLGQTNHIVGVTPTLAVASPAATPPTAQPSPIVSPSPAPSATGASATASLGVLNADLTQTFSSPLFGYTMRYATGWTTTPGTSRWTGPDNSGPKADQIQITGSDTTIWGSSKALAPGENFDKWAAAYHAYLAQNMEPQCDGGDPASWQPIQIGTLIGKRIDFCNASEAVIAVGGRIYDFGLGQDTFNSADHADPTIFETMLKSVVFKPKSGK
jgi:hypothetical protein